MIDDTIRTAPEAPGPQAPAARRRNPLLAFLLADRTARWTSRILLIVVWQLAGGLSERMPTPIETFKFIVDEFHRPFGGAAEPWSLYHNELVYNLLESIGRTAAAMLLVTIFGIVIGYAMGRWWRVQAFFTDIVTVGLALPAFMWALLTVMWFGFGFRAPVFCAFVSATPGLIIHVFQGTLAVPRELRDMSDAYGVPFRQQLRHLVLPSVADVLLAGFRLAIVAAWGCVVLVEWFGSSEGAGFRARYWYIANDYNGLMGWGVVILVVVITIDRGILERIDKHAHRWRSAITGFGAQKS
jgi:ABC-type nitrate/sulfonate/bicarbonate transport system permease component